MSLFRFATRVAAVGLFAFALACGGNDTPATPPTPSPTPVQATPSPTPAPVQTNCDRLGPGVEAGGRCSRETANFQKEVDDAIAQLRGERPDIFDGRNVLSVGQYLVGVIEILEEKGLCAGYDGEELQVKNNNDYSDQYHILTSNFQYRDGFGSYRVTCYPAAFPLPEPSPGQVGGCSLPGSRSIGCGRERPSYLAQVDAAIQAVADENPAIIDKSQVSGGQGWYRVLNVDAYVEAVRLKLNAAGFCAVWDGFEMAVKKENRFSDQYDILAGDGYTRRGEGSYRVTCYPATF